MTKYVVSGYIGFDNFGDEAICGVLTSYLKNIGAEKVSVLSANPEKTSKLYGVDSAHMLKFFKPIIESDVLISGGGSLLQDITSLKSLIYYIAIIATAIAFGKKVYIFAQGFTPFRTKFGELLTKFVLKYCEKISVRDLKSKELLKNLGIESELVADPVYGVQIIPSEHNGIGVQLRNFEGLNDDFLEGLANAIAKNFSGQKIKLFSLQDSVDLAVIDKFAGILASKELITEIYKNTSVAETIKEITSLEYIISMRFHSDLIALKAGVKVLGINYDVKVKTLSEEVGFPIINMYGCEADSGVKALMESSAEAYKIPEFDMKKALF